MVALGRFVNPVGLHDFAVYKSVIFREGISAHRVLEMLHAHLVVALVFGLIDTFRRGVGLVYSRHAREDRLIPRGQDVHVRTVAVLAALVMLAACTTTPRGSFCEIAEPIRPANVDVLTDAEVRDILAHNEKGAALCGWKT
jgi:hypothetical protein